MPPAALTSATAWSVPFLICAPSVALGPVIGPATPILICAAAEPANAAAKPSARPSAVICLIAPTPLVGPRLRRRAIGQVPIQAAFAAKVTHNPRARCPLLGAAGPS